MEHKYEIHFIQIPSDFCLHDIELCVFEPEPR
jgi:hypothetical protein